MVHLEIKPSWASLTTMFLFLLSKALPDSALFTCEVLCLPKSFPIPEMTSLLCHLKIPKPCLLCWPPSCTTSSQRGSPELTSFMAFLIPCPDQWRDPPMKEEDWWHFTILKILLHTYTQKQLVHSGLQPSLSPVAAIISHSFAKCMVQQAPVLHGGSKYKGWCGGKFS